MHNHLQSIKLFPILLFKSKWRMRNLIEMKQWSIMLENYKVMLFGKH